MHAWWRGWVLIDQSNLLFRFIQFKVIWRAVDHDHGLFFFFCLKSWQWPFSLLFFFFIFPNEYFFFARKTRFTYSLIRARKLWFLWISISGGASDFPTSSCHFLPYINPAFVKLSWAGKLRYIHGLIGAIWTCKIFSVAFILLRDRSRLGFLEVLKNYSCCC